MTSMSTTTSAGLLKSQDRIGQARWALSLEDLGAWEGSCELPHDHWTFSAKKPRNEGCVLGLSGRFLSPKSERNGCLESQLSQQTKAFSLTVEERDVVRQNKGKEGV